MAEPVQRARLVRGGGALLPVVAVAAVALILVPLPPVLVDVLLATSLGLGLWLLALALAAPSQEGLGFLPNLLVLYTLFRLALNLGTTRLILGTGEGGRVIEAFGRFMVGGSYLVGGVVFAIITVVQFLVIARGTARVAEVTARFSLDGLPGRQRAIEGELTARVIDGAEARRRRTQLERESLLHGGLDGAMRFLQGDAIAGLLITCVNLVGGLVVGVTQLGLTLSEALSRFGLLTIGDGLATQVPALLTATATGLVVTRVAGVDPTAPPGEELTRQLLGRPMLLGLVAGVLALLAVLPGFPAGPLLAVAGACAVLYAVALRHRPLPAPGVLDPPVPVRLVLQWGEALAQGVGVGPLAAACEQELARLGARLGIPVPLPQLQPLADPDGATDGWRLLLDGVPLAEGRQEPVEREVARRLAERVAAALLPVAGELVGVAETRRLLDRLGEVAPDLTRAVVPERLDVPTLAAVLRGLLRGGVPVADLRGVLEALAAAPAEERAPELLIERVRTARRRLLSHQLLDGRSRLGVYVVDPVVEAALHDAASGRAETGTLRLDRALLGDLRQALHRCSPAPAGAADPRPVLLTTPELRRHLEQALAGRARVITGQELDPEVSVEPLGIFGP